MRRGRGLLAWLAAAAVLSGATRSGARAEYALGIRDSIMIAHSFKGKEFGPAQKVRLVARGDARHPRAWLTRAHALVS